MHLKTRQGWKKKVLNNRAMLLIRRLVQDLSVIFYCFISITHTKTVPLSPPLFLPLKGT